tara:strand:+ start:555 stop:839 length:285 start_codon:yes stop_codon:yes gene_type:complete
VSEAVAKQKRSVGTADEHKMYTRLFDGWLVREGFGSFFEAIIENELNSYDVNVHANVHVTSLDHLVCVAERQTRHHKLSRRADERRLAGEFLQL